MRKAWLILMVPLITIVVIVAGLGIAILDVAGNLATDSKHLPHGSAIGRALVVYDPGLSGGARDVATKIGYNLQSSGYDVTLAGMRSQAAANVTGYGVIVIGGPIYGGAPASSLQSYLNGLSPQPMTRVGVFGYGMVKIDSADVAAVTKEVAPLPSGSPVTLGAVMKVAIGDNIDGRCSEFVSALLG